MGPPTGHMAREVDPSGPRPPSLAYFDHFEALLDAELARPDTKFRILDPIPYSQLSPELVEREVVEQGLPLLVSGVTDDWARELDPSAFSWHWLRDNFGATKLINSPRDTQSMEDIAGWNIADFVNYLTRFIFVPRIAPFSHFSLFSRYLFLSLLFSNFAYNSTVLLQLNFNLSLYYLAFLINSLCGLDALVYLV